jgi:hypothetical protein
MTKLYNVNLVNKAVGYTLSACGIEAELNEALAT